MRTVIVKGGERLFDGSKQAMLNPVTNHDRVMVDDEWIPATDVDERIPVIKVEHFGRHISTAGEVIAVETLKSVSIIGKVEILKMYKVHTDRLTQKEVELIGYDDLDTLKSIERLGSRWMWLMIVHPATSKEVLH